MPDGLGLDFGTTTTLLATGGELVPLGVLHPWLPSLVGVADDGSIVVGEDAADHRRTIRSVKRAITKRWNEIRDSALALPHTVTADELIVELLGAVADRALSRGVELRAAAALAVGCPAVWDSGQRRRLLRLLERAGIPAGMADLVEEPIAAGIAWLERAQRIEESTRIVVFDMGGGTLDIGVLLRDADDVQLLAAVGRAEAGDSLDEAIADDLALDVGAAPMDDADPAHTRHRRELLLHWARQAKIGLTSEEEFAVVLPADLFPGRPEVWYTRARLEAAFAPQMDRAIELVRVALRIAELSCPGSSSSVDVVLLSGGMSRIPYVEARLRAALGPGTAVLPAAEPPEVAVVRGLGSARRYRRNCRYALAYDIVLEWDEGSVSLYESYMPIIESWWIERGWQGELRFLCVGRGLDLPDRGTGVLRVVSDSGEPVGATLNGRSLDGHPVALNGQAFQFAIYPSGRLVMVDGAGTHEGRVRD